jgi:hypothetical protein
VVDIVRAYQDPERYATEISVDKIVADEKVHKEGVERYVKLIKGGEELKPIIVIKHPTEDEYAVLNGHHRFWAMKESGKKVTNAVVVEDPLGVGFHLTKNGHLQPSPEITKYIRIPAKRFQSYIDEFWKDPKGMLREQINIYKK